MRPWLSIIGIGEDGLDGLSDASRNALAAADVVFGGARHLQLAAIGDRGRAWDVPFSIAPVLARRGHATAVLASGDPFWFGVGSTLAEQLDVGEWQAFPNISTFSIIAARLGWKIEETICLGLHAAPFERLARCLAPGRHLICLLRDGEAVGELGRWLHENGFGASSSFVFEAVGGPRERRQECTAEDLVNITARSPVAVALRLEGKARAIRASGLPDHHFQHDGQITKRPIRALTISALAPRAGERLWDIGAGSGSVSIEWLLATGRTGTAIAIEPRADRANTLRANAAAFGLGDRLDVVEASAPAALAGLATPQAIFVGGGANDAVLEAIFDLATAGTRLVVSAVTLETETLLASWSGRKGGELMRLEIAHATPLGGRRGWAPSRPIVQWSVTL